MLKTDLFGHIVNIIDNLSKVSYIKYMIIRIMSRKIKELAGKFPIVATLGPRQSGKTTLVRSCFPDRRYLSLEDLDNREFAENDPRGFIASLRNEPAILDEIQRTPNLFSYLQTQVDKTNNPGQFILTGSHNYLLQENISQTLAGRVAILKLLPFSINELQNTLFECHDALEYLFKGFYPRIYDQQIAPQDWYPNYIQTYIERDVRLIKNISDLSAFQRFVKLCAGRIGQIVNFSSLGNDCGVSHNTVKVWLSILESSYIIFLLRPHYQNFNKRLIQMPKLYFFDPGLACALLGINDLNQLDTHYLRGSLFESMIIAEIFKNQLNQGLEPRTYYWRDKLGHEIDCILETKKGLIPIEIKSSQTISADFFKGLEYWNKLSKNTPENSYLIYGGSSNQIRSNGTVLGWRSIQEIWD